MFAWDAVLAKQCCLVAASLQTTYYKQLMTSFVHIWHCACNRECSKQGKLRMKSGVAGSEHEAGELAQGSQRCRVLHNVSEALTASLGRGHRNIAQHLSRAAIARPRRQPKTLSFMNSKPGMHWQGKSHTKCWRLAFGGGKEELQQMEFPFCCPKMSGDILTQPSC